MTPSSNQPRADNVPPPPRQPSPRARRLVFRFQSRQLVLLIMGLIFCLVGGAQALVLDRRLPAELALTLGSRSSTGHVTGSELERRIRLNDRHPTLISFTYDLDGVQHASTSLTTDPQLIAAAEPGRDVPIEIARMHHEWARIAGARISVLGLWGLLMLVFPLLGLTFILLAMRARRRAMRAFIHGHPTTARVTFAGPDRKTRINGRHPLLVRWEFSLEGKLFKGSVSSMKPELIEPFLSVAELVVLYDPENPRINTVYLE